jgi:hypothetical protein
MKTFKTTAEYLNFLQNLSPEVLECYFQAWDETGRPVSETPRADFVRKAIEICIKKELTGDASPVNRPTRFANMFKEAFPEEKDLLLCLLESTKMISWLSR